MLKLRYRAKLTLVYLLLFVVVQSLISLVFVQTMADNVRSQALQQLDTSALIFQRIVQQRVDVLGASAQLLSKDYGFREAIATEDLKTIRSALQNQKARFGADLAYLLDLDERVTAVTDTNQPMRIPNISDALKNMAEAEGIGAKLVELDGHLYQLVVVPVQAPITIAWVAFGFELDGEYAQEIKRLSAIDLEVAFVHRPGSDARFQLANDFADAPVFEQSGTGSQDRADISTDAFDKGGIFYKYLPLSSRDDGTLIAAILSYSESSAYQPYRLLFITTVVILGVGFLLLVIGSLVAANGITRPLRQLTTAVQQVAGGDYHEVKCTSHGDEIADLTDSFNTMVNTVREREQRILFQAYHDTETGLPNRLQFEKQLNNQCGERNPYTLAIIEVQQLRELRTFLDHTNISELMQGVGARLQQILTSEVARLSTETFAAVIQSPGDTNQKVAEVLERFLEPCQVAGIVVDIQLRIGLVNFPSDGEDAELLLRQAHAALDRCRTSGKPYAWFDQDSAVLQKRRLSIMSELRQGLKNGEVQFAYQPKVNLASGQVEVVEALVRWNSTTHGFIPPDEFIPIAERTGDIRHLTDWGLETAIRQASDWHNQGLEIAVALNLSATDLTNHRLPEQVMGLLNRYQLPIRLLKLEVTESAVMHDMDRALAVLNRLHDLGLFLSIDDYGTGYSSLSYLKQLPMDELKIDKAFVLKLASNIEDQILVRSTIELAHNLGLTVTAEGVEDAQSVELLRQYGCDMVQGFHICRPIGADELENFVRSQNDNEPS
ncbi:putative bifunctional diguanylate cyclase/phosphodiesterase [Motiliproteus sp.]|uniref:putative bifunctional diguanylate cyclase/phosphodiesterase n=1 Tax=Motiliproteus sp. TaxID=1898955 RepID=UPI003BAAE475